MSDTDDTDVLLASDPGGGLDMFLGLSLKELSDKHKNILNTSTTVPHVDSSGAVAGASDHSSSEPKKSIADSTLNNLEELDTSDFFNSRGELVLSGLSEWTDSDVEAHTPDEDARSEAGSDASFTFETVLQPETPKIVGENRQQLALNLSQIEQQENIIDERDREIVIDTSKHNNIVSSSFKTFLDMSFGRTPSHLHRNPNFGRVVDINLLKPAAGWNIPLPNHSTGQVFTRAPNFRTPGGYKPSPDPKEFRELTDDEMHEEVLKMYAFPDELDNLNEQRDENSNPPQKVSFATEEEIINDSEKQDSTPINSLKNQRTPKVRFDFMNGENKPPVFSSEPSDEKAMKRKHLISGHGSLTGSGDCGSPSPSESSVRFNMEDGLDVSKPKTRTPTKKVTYSTKVVRGKKSDKKSDKKKSTSGFSFGYGESESELSPIKGMGGDIFNTPGSASSIDVRLPSTASSVPYSLAELKTVWREIQERKNMLEEANRNIPDTKNLGSASSVATEKEFRGSEKTNDQNQQDMSHSESLKYSPRGTDKDRSLSTQSQSQPSSSPLVNRSRSIDQDNKYLPLLESFASDLEAILLEADINPDEFEDIIDDLQSGTGTNMANLVGLSENFDTVDRGDGCEVLEPSDAAAQVQLSDWAKSGAVEYVEKYQDERLRREQCELEIQKLQKELLEIKQRNAVLDGKMKKKDKLLFQISSAWHNVSKEWKTHEAISQAALSKLQKEQNDLTTACTEGEERIRQYEQELVKTLELADSFKCRIVQMEDTKTIAVMKIEEEKGQMAEIIGRMEKDVDDLKHEKEAALRALRESQLQLDERTTVHNKIQSELISLEENAHQNAKRFETLVEQKKTLESHLQNVTQRKLEVENELQSLTRELEAVRIEKEDLRRNLENTAARQMKEEGDRLHEYYNKQVQEVLNSAKEKAAKAEVNLMNSMKKASSESERKLNECKERHNLEVKRLTSQYECELQMLKKENLQKQLLITTTAQQLQSGELARSSAVNRLQTIVSSMPDNSSVNSERATKDRRRGSECSALQIAQNNIQYSRFTQNLSASGQNHQITASQSADFGGFRLNTSSMVGDSPQVQDMSRYNKTSTPITTSEMLTDASNQTCPSKDNVLSKASKLCKYFETANSNLGIITQSRVLGTNNTLNDMRPNGYVLGVESVEHDRRVRSLLKHPVQVLNSVDPILETPVRLQKEGGLPVVESPDSELDAKIDPALQKCLEELIKNYAQKLDVIQTQKETLISAVVQTGNIPANNNQTNFPAAVQPPNKVKVKVSNIKTDKVSSSSSSMPVPESDNLNKNCNIKGDRDSSKDKAAGTQPSGKRPWK